MQIYITGLVLALILGAISAVLHVRNGGVIKLEDPFAIVGISLLSWFGGVFLAYCIYLQVSDGKYTL